MSSSQPPSSNPAATWGLLGLSGLAIVAITIGAILHGLDWLQAIAYIIGVLGANNVMVTRQAAAAAIAPLSQQLETHTAQHAMQQQADQPPTPIRFPDPPQPPKG